MVKWCFGLELDKSFLKIFMFSKMLKELISSLILSIIIKEDLIILNVTLENFLKLIIFLKYNSLLQFKMLLDIWAVDFLKSSFGKKRFEINYLLVSPINNVRVIIKLRIGEEDQLCSLLKIFNSAGWLEREIWDLFGLFFKNHDDLRRILTDYSLVGHPLRKDFPLMGYLEVRYDDEEKRIIFDKIDMVQGYRFFDFKDPWKI